MLILSRRENEEVRIGDDIQIKILHIHRENVRIGILAPRDISVHREEIYEKIQQEKVCGAPPAE